MKLNQKKENAISDTLKRFDFVKVYQVMNFLGWKWLDNSQSPTVKELKICAERLLRHVMYDKNVNETSTGSFTAKKYTDSNLVVLELSFYVEERQTYL